MQQAINNTPMSIIFKINNYCTVYHKIKEQNSCKSSKQSFPWSLHVKVFLNLQLNPRCILQLLLSWLFHSWNLDFSWTIFTIIVYFVILFHVQCATIFSENIHFHPQKGQWACFMGRVVVKKSWGKPKNLHWGDYRFFLMHTFSLLHCLCFYCETLSPILYYCVK